MDKKLSACANPDCGKQLLAVRDAIEVLGGKWRIPIITVLGYYKTRRFKELQAEITGITAKMLSKELKELEANQLITRTVQDTRPISVIYEMTPYGYSSSKIIRELYDWGVAHRKKIME